MKNYTINSMENKNENKTMEDLEGLEYDELVLHENVHKLTGKLTKSQGENTAEVEIDKGSFWLVTGLGQLSDKAPEQAIADSVKNIIIVDKNKLAEFIKKKLKTELNKKK